MADPREQEVVTGRGRCAAGGKAKGRAGPGLAQSRAVASEASERVNAALEEDGTGRESGRGRGCTVESCRAISELLLRAGPDETRDDGSLFGGACAGRLSGTRVAGRAGAEKEGSSSSSSRKAERRATTSGPEEVTVSRPEEESLLGQGTLSLLARSRRGRRSAAVEGPTLWVRPLVPRPSERFWEPTPETEAGPKGRGRRTSTLPDGRAVGESRSCSLDLACQDGSACRRVARRRRPLCSSLVAGPEEARRDRRLNAQPTAPTLQAAPPISPSRSESRRRRRRHVAPLQPCLELDTATSDDHDQHHPSKRSPASPPPDPVARRLPG